LQLCSSFSFKQLVARIKEEQKKKEEVENGKEGGEMRVEENMEGE